MYHIYRYLCYMYMYVFLFIVKKWKGIQLKDNIEHKSL